MGSNHVVTQPNAINILSLRDKDIIAKTHHKRQNEMLLQQVLREALGRKMTAPNP
jgi:hypothetical protein